MQTTLAILLGILIFTVTPAQAGHELPYYPSFYPQEIRIEAVDPHAAATRLPTASLHAYIGSEPGFGQTIPDNVASVESLGSYLVVTFNPASKSMKSQENRCTLARTLVTSLAKGQEPFVFHPYPVTPYHPDYLEHFDLVETAKQEYQTNAQGSIPLPLKVRIQGKLAKQLVPEMEPITGEGPWDAVIEEIPTGSLIASHMLSFNGWLGPPWLKAGWFHTYLLFAGVITDETTKQAVDSLYQSLVRGNYHRLAERFNLERQLVSLLTQGCERVVVGYTVQREYYNTDFSAGVENVAADSHTGFYSPLFLRTVKLKDFPWNGWLRLGLDAKPAAAWNPIGGFTDTAGRLIWFGLGDPAFLPTPSSGTWIPNRVRLDTADGSSAEDVEVPRDAVFPEPGTGILRAVDGGKTAKTKITYQVLTSAFHDKTRMTVADLLYPYIFSARWGVRTPQNEREYDPVIAQATTLVRERLVGLKVIRIDKEVMGFGEIRVEHEIPVIEVYVDYTTLDPQRVASLAPPWSNLPWHVIVLMEEAVKRGWAAFSLEEAQRWGVAWLDLVRDPQVKERLALLVAEFASQGYIPETLKDHVTVEEAKERWIALQQFFQTHDHFLVTNGPYFLREGSESTAVLEVFRDLSYPLGVGTFDQYVSPPRALHLTVTLQNNGLKIRAEMEKIEKAMRSYTTVQAPLQHDSMVGVYPVKAVANYAVIGPEGTVLQAGTSPIGDDNMFTVDLQGKLAPGLYTILTALSLNENAVRPEVHRVQYRVKGDS